jgi:hypothetical protein
MNNIKHNEEAIEEIAHYNKKAKSDNTYVRAGVNTVAEVLDTMKKHPGTKMNDILRKMQG